MKYTNLFLCTAFINLFACASPDPVSEKTPQSSSDKAPSGHALESVSPKSEQETTERTFSGKPEADATEEKDLLPDEYMLISGTANPSFSAGLDVTIKEDAEGINATQTDVFNAR